MSQARRSRASYQNPSESTCAAAHARGVRLEIGADEICILYTWPQWEMSSRVPGNIVVPYSFCISLHGILEVMCFNMGSILTKP
jgi:hypothetical protein